MKDTKRISIIVLIVFCFNFTLKAQKDSVETLLKRPFQLTFVSPVGTNGLESGKYQNNISLNMLAGYAGGLNGFEFGGIANIVKEKSFGGQFAGFANVVRSDFQGGQFAGFTNVVWGDLEGIQCSGFANIVRKGVTGFQISGFTNVLTESSKAVQIAGFSNHATDTLEGIQVSGFINTAKVVKGSQIGFINICDSISGGVPLGFLSIVKNGLRQFEIGSGETFHTTLSYKIGVDKFYNIFSVGAKFTKDRIVPAAGFGLGTKIDIKSKYSLNVELLNYSIIERYTMYSYSDLSYENISKLHITVSKEFSKHFNVYAGPTFNVSSSSSWNSEGNIKLSEVVPYSIYGSTIGNTRVEIYPGFSCGLRF